MTKNISHSFRVNRFSQGPKLEVIVLFDKKTEFTVKLEKSPEFTLKYASVLNEKLYEEIKAWLEAYSMKKEAPMHFLPRQNLPAFSSSAVSALKRVLFGKKVSYGELALLAGSPKASRAIGSICRKNPFPLLIPCHRVLASKGGLGGFAFGPELKKELLEFEA